MWVFSTDRKVEAFVAEDGKQYVFDSDAKKWVTPADKIEEDLEGLRGVAEPPSLLPTDETITSSSRSNGAGSALKGDTEDAEALALEPETQSEEKTKKTKKKKKSDKWQKAKSRTWVYVNGLPLDVTVQEVHDHFVKCGVVQQDLVTGVPRIKLYENRAFGGLNVRPPQEDSVWVSIDSRVLVGVGRRVRVLHEGGVCGAGSAAPRQVADPSRVRDWNAVVLWSAWLLSGFARYSSSSIKGHELTNEWVGPCAATFTVGGRSTWRRLCFSRKGASS